MRELLNIGKKKYPIKTLKLSADISADVLQNLFNVLSTGNFPDNTKLADISSVFKKRRSFKKRNYRPVSVLYAISKFFEKLMQKQIVGYKENFLSPYLRGFRKSFNTHKALLALTENWNKVLQNKGFEAAVLLDLSKAFDKINHDHLIAKLHVYDFSNNSLKLLHIYLNNRWHRAKINRNLVHGKS